MADDFLLKFFNAHPDLFLYTKTGLWIILGGVAGAIIQSYRLGRKHERTKIDAVKLAEAKKAADDATRDYENEKVRADGLEAEIKKLTEVVFFRSWIIHKHSPRPRSPLCPACHGHGKNVPMTQRSSRGRGEYFICSDSECKSSIPIDENEAEQLFELLGTKGCYDTAPKEPRARRKSNFW